MGLFSAKKGDDKVGGGAPHDNGHEGGAARLPGMTADEGPRTRYGIEQAIQLMRSLPADEKQVELVVTVVKTTLESLRVKVTDIIRDAERKEHEIEARVATLKGEIAGFEKEVERRVEEIARLEADHAETSSVKQRLEMAEMSASIIEEQTGPVSPDKVIVSPHKG